MSKTWVYSDPHFGHKNICKFVNFDGTKVRPWDDVEQMNEEMIQWYNEIVNDEDRVYILGDVSFSPAGMKNFGGRLKGRKCLVPGNHDPVKMRKYFEIFDDVRGYVQRSGFIMSHIPLHPHCLGRWRLNIHGHLHNNTVKVEEEVLQEVGRNLKKHKVEVEDTRYYNACVERTNFRPKLLDEILHERGLK